MCPSIDQADHTSKAAANGVKNVVDRFFGDDVVVVTRIMGDSGSGGAV